MRGSIIAGQIDDLAANTLDADLDDPVAFFFKGNHGLAGIGEGRPGGAERGEARRAGMILRG